MTSDFTFKFEQAPPGPVRLAVGRWVLFHAPESLLPAAPIGSPSASGKETQ